MKRAKQLSNLFLPLAMVGIALITGCENDLKDIQKISASEVNKPIERYTGVDVIYSDSARVKAHMTAPLMIIYKVKKPYTEMPKGVKVVFYDNNLQESSTVVADYAIRHDLEKTIELDKNVVGTNVKGDTFTSDELIWDENTRQIHSSKLVHVKLADGSITDGTGFTSDENFNHWVLTQGTGKINVKDQGIAQ
ncbi:MAG TPA: LPS export ABC transporter periplasmic protein LptC [Mucilaginibacter sp.]|jgi:LPS export ABC transporter protein LptC